MRKSKTIRIYKRFDFKLAMAHNARKKRKKYQSLSLYQYLVMLYYMLRLNNRQFKIYKMLRKHNVTITSTKSLDFICKYHDEILEWLNSKYFKEQYLDTNHPYPPLLNPERLNIRVQSYENGLQSEEREGKSLETKHIQPYPISYESISPELAWDLNLPLPPLWVCVVDCLGKR